LYASSVASVYCDGLEGDITPPTIRSLFFIASVLMGASSNFLAADAELPAALEFKSYGLDVCFYIFSFNYK